MNIELKNIKIYKELSEETRCFTATLYIDGVNKGRVSNRGQGGENSYDDMTWNELKEVNIWCESNLPMFEYAGRKMKTDLELHLENIMDEYENTKWFKRHTKNHILIIDDECKKGQFYKYKKASLPDDAPEVIYKKLKELKCFEGKNPIILNELDIKEAISLV